MSRYRWKALLIESSYEDIKLRMMRLKQYPGPSKCRFSTLDALEAVWDSGDLYVSLSPLAEGKAQAGFQAFTYCIWKQMDSSAICRRGSVKSVF
jgi:hypothetical protein